MVTIEVRAIENMEAGQLLEMAYLGLGSWAVRPFSGRWRDRQSIGVAARKIVEGEILQFVPHANTADILTHVAGIDKNGA
jgi:hypothetical protein